MKPILGPMLPTILAILLSSALIALPAEAKKKPAGKTAAPAAGQDQNANITDPAAATPPPYRSRILRLAEILGALTHLDDLCDAKGDAGWRASMRALMDAEAKTDFEKELLAGTFNRSFRGYQISYRVCTPNAQIIIGRFLTEGSRIAHEVADRYGAS